MWLFLYICHVKGIKTTIYTKLEKLPEVSDRNFFHSRLLFAISAQTPRMKPYMTVCTDDSGLVLSQLLTIVRYRTSFLPPFFFMHCRILGEGDYAESSYRREDLFGEMLQAITSRLNKTTLYIEVSNLGQKMFGYRHFRQESYFPVHWMSIHNSLHSRTPEERISEKIQQRIDNAYAKGVTTGEVGSKEDFMHFTKLLRKHHWLKPKRYIPDDRFFREAMTTDACRLFVTKFRQHVIGCAACVYSQNNAYLWYAAFRRKTYLPLHPDTLTIWHCIKYAHSQGYEHINFMDVGLPFRKNSFREFILSFGGKPVSTLRWFRCSIRWINAVLSWIYRD